MSEREFLLQYIIYLLLNSCSRESKDESCKVGHCRNCLLDAIDLWTVVIFCGGSGKLLILA